MAIRLIQVAERIVDSMKIDIDVRRRTSDYDFSKRQSIEIARVPREQIDERYLDSPYYIAPDGQVGQDAFAVIREAMNPRQSQSSERALVERTQADHAERSKTRQRSRSD